jgi:hypothetical protein
MSNFRLYILSFLLAALAIGVFTYKVFWLDFPLQSDTASNYWTIETSVSFTGKNKPVKVSLVIPRSDRSNLVMDENFISQGFGVTTGQKGFNRKATWSIRNVKGPQKLYYRAVVRKIAKEEEESFALPPAKIPSKNFDEANDLAVETLIDKILAVSADEETFISVLLKYLERPNENEELAFVLRGQQSQRHKMNTAARILRQAGIPARSAHGLPLTGSLRHAELEHWIEVYQKNKWVSYGQRNKSRDESDYLVWSRGEDPILDVVGSQDPSFSLSVELNNERAIESALVRSKTLQRFFYEYSLSSLPLSTQATLRIMLSLPLGALIIVLLRNVIGLSTIGTFMPVLIGIAFRQTQLVTGVVLFSIIIAVGLSARFFLEKFKLLLIPRVASVLVIVVLLIALISLLSHKLGLSLGISIALFPIVILTLTIERMCIIWEEGNPGDAIYQCTMTLIAAACCYFILGDPRCEHLFFVFPELNLLVLSIILPLGRYSGYRLTELYRFRSFISAKE